MVTHNDMVEMLTNYDYTIDATSDAGGAPETFGPEAGNGIISAQQMCRWVADNCAQACPGESSTMMRLTRIVLQKIFQGRSRPRLMTSGPESCKIIFFFRCHNIIEKGCDTSRPGPLLPLEFSGKLGLLEPNLFRRTMYKKCRVLKRAASPNRTSVSASSVIF